MKKIFPVFLLLIGIGLHAQYKAPYFNLLGVDNGLPHPGVQVKLEDKYGYMWVGTINGLARFDGYQLKQYPIINEEGLPVKPQSINRLFEDSKGDLWIAVGLNGLFRLDRQQNRFEHVSLGAGNDELFNKINVLYLVEDKVQNLFWVNGYDASRDKRSVFSIDVASKKLQIYNELGKGNLYLPTGNNMGLAKGTDERIWLLSDSTLHLFDRTAKSFKPYFLLPGLPVLQRFISVVPDPVDPDLLWINSNKTLDAGTNPPKEIRGLLRFHTKTKTYQFSYPGSAEAGTIRRNCFHTLTDSLKRIWISVEGGVSLYDRKTGQFTFYPLQFTQAASHVETVASDPEGNIWVAGNLGGLIFLDTKSGKTYPYESNGETGSFSANVVQRDLFFDRSGTFWITLLNEGLAWQDKKKTQFAPVPIRSGARSSGYGDKLPQYAIAGVEGDSILYIKDSTSLQAWNVLRNQFTPIDLKEKKNYEFVMNVIRGRGGHLWLACGLNGLLEYDPVSRKMTDHGKVNGDTNHLAGAFIIDIAADKNGTIWVATDPFGLMSYDPGTQKFTKYPFIINNGTRFTRDSLDDKTATCLWIDEQGVIWIGTNNGGVNSYDPRSKKFRSYLNPKEAFFAITYMYEDSQKRFWVATYLSGLFLLDKKTGSLKNYSEKNGILYNTVFNVMEDAEGNIWAITQKGISRINPVTNAITNFPSARPWVYEFTARGLYDRNGIFNLPGRNGILQFNPLKIDKNSSPPPVYIESLVFRSGGMKSDSLLYTDGRKSIRLKHNENRISFQYVALHFAGPEDNQYAYMLEGYDKDWIQAGTQRSVTYSNLPPGQYFFKVKAANGDGVWNESPVSFEVNILPPWYKTWWAYCLYVLLAVGFIWAYIQMRSRALRRENLVLEQKVEHRTRQLKESIESLKETQAQLIQSEKMASLGELTAGIAHEIQNPLNFVNNFSELNHELLTELNEEIGKGNLEEVRNIARSVTDNEEKILFHGKRADAIVKGMLQHSRAGNGQKEPVDINALCDEYLRLAYHGLRAKDKSFNARFETDFDGQVGKINVLPQDLGRVILNLINNAFYAVTERKKRGEAGYEPTVTVSTQRTRGNGSDKESEVIIRVKDNGTGIPEAIREKIFQPFYTTKPAGQGTGLGLSMAYDIITKGHGGELKVTSTENEGTVFAIQIPIS